MKKPIAIISAVLLMGLIFHFKNLKYQEYLKKFESEGNEILYLDDNSKIGRFKEFIFGKKIEVIVLNGNDLNKLKGFHKTDFLTIFSDNLTSSKGLPDSIEPKTVNFLSKRNNRAFSDLYIHFESNFDFNHFPDLPSVNALHFDPNNLADIKFLKKFPNLKELHFEDTNLESFEGIQHCPELVELNISVNNVKDGSLLSELKKLKHLNISGVPLKDFTFLKELTKLEYLDLSYTYFSDTKILTHLKHLKDLRVRYTKVTTFEGIDFSKLECFAIDEETEIEQQEIINLIGKYPNCHFMWY